MFESLALSLAEYVLTKVAESVVRKQDRRRVEKEVANALREAIGRVLQTYAIPSGDMHVADFLDREEVKQELAKLIIPHEQPTPDYLARRWSELYGSSGSDLRLVMESFLTETEKRLNGVPALYPVLARRDTVVLKREFSGIAHQTSAMTSQIDRLVEINESGKHEYQPIIDLCRRLYSGNRPNAALTELLPLVERTKQGTVPVAIRTQIYTVVAACRLALGSTLEAVGWFKRAYTLDNKSPRTRSNWALALYLQEEYREAASLAQSVLDAGARDTNAAAVWAWSESRMLGDADPCQIVREQYMDDLGYVRALALVFLDHKSARAEEFCRRCLAMDGDDVQAHLILSRSLFHQSVKDVAVGISASTHLAPSPGLMESLEHASMAVDLAVAGDNRVLVHEALIVRARTLGALDRHGDAQADLDAVLREDPSNERALFNLGLDRMNSGQYRAAIQAFEATHPEHRLYPTWQSLAQCHLILKSPKDAQEALAQAANYEVDHYHYLQKAEALIQLGDCDAAIAIREELANSADAEALHVAAIISRLLNHPDCETTLLERAYDAAVGQEKAHMAAELGVASVLKHDFVGAKEWFLHSGDSVIINPRVAEDYLYCLFKTHEFEAALAQIAVRRQIGEIGVHEIDVEAVIRELQGDADKALGLYQELATMRPDDPSHKANMIRIALMNGDVKSARDQVDKLDVAGCADVQVLLQTSSLLRELGYFERSLQTCQEALRLGWWTHPEAHLTYLGLLTSMEHHPMLRAAEQVSQESAVLVSRSGDRKWLWLGWRDQPQADCIPSDSAPAKLLIGHEVGDMVPLRVTDFEDDTYEIIAIENLFVRLFQLSMEHFAILFPDDLSLQRIRVEENDPTELMTMVAGMSAHTQTCLDEYDCGKVPLGVLANMMGRDRWDVQLGIEKDPEHRLLVRPGGPLARVSEDLSRHALECVVDLSVLLTLQQTGCLDILSESMRKMIIPYHLIVELRSKQVMMAHQSNKMMGYHKGRWYLDEVSDAVSEQEKQRVQEVLGFVLDNCSVGILKPGNAAILHEESRLVDLCGICSVACIVLAAQEQVPLFSDDAALCRLEVQGLAAKSLSTYDLLHMLRLTGDLSDNTYLEAVAQLVLLSHDYTPVTAELLLHTLRRRDIGWSDKAKVVNVLSGPDTADDGAADVAAQVLREVYLRREFAPSKAIIVDHFFGSLATGRNPQPVFIRLAQNMGALLRLAPVQVQEFLRDAQAWLIAGDFDVPSILVP